MLTLRPATIIWVALSMVAAAHGQRVFSTVPTPDIEGLRFDSNDIPLTTASPSSSSDFNFSPNVIFSPNSTRAFVSFPGLNRILVFDPRSGEILQTLEVADNPARLTLSPDGRRLAVPSIRLKANLPNVNSLQGDEVGSISVIDIESLEVRTLDLDEVTFSFENNIVFSADSSTGFIASAKTDEIVRFDVETMTEIDPRLAFDGGTRPVSLAMAPDFSFFTVILVGSTALPQAEQPDTIQVVDPDTFQVIRSIVPTPTEIPTQDGSTVKVPHDLMAPNNLSISPDGKWGVIADQENAISSLIPELAADHALLINLETGELEEVFGIGGFGGPSTVCPAGIFAVASAVDVTFIDPAEKRSWDSGSLLSLYRESSRPVFSADFKSLYVASPVRDEISVIDVATGALRKQVPVAIDFEREQPAIPAAPLDVAVSPDGSILTVLNFNANTIDLLSNSLRIMVPEFLSTDHWFTGVALTNNSSAAVAEIIAAGVSRTGIRFTDLTTTEDPESIRKTTDNGATYTDYTNSNVVLSSLSTLADGDWLVIGHSAPFRRIAADITDGNQNASELSVHYWDGTAWSEVTDLSDGTTSQEATLAVDGSIAFQIPGTWVVNTVDGVSAYHVRLTVGAALDSSVTVASLGADVVEFVNPKTLTLEPDHQVAFTPVELLEPLSPREVDGWLDMDSNVLEVTGFYLTGDTDILRLDGALAGTEIHQTYVIPEVPVATDLSTLVNLVNPNFTADSVTLDLVNSSGEVVASSEQGLASWFAPARFLYPPDHAPTTIRRTANNGTSYTNYTNGTIVLDGMDTQANGHWLVIGFSEPFGRLRADIAEPNENTSVLSIDHWNGENWVAVSSLTDPTSVAGATLAVSGTVAFQVPATWEPNTVDGVSAYHVRLSVGSVLDDSVSASALDVALPTEVDAFFSRDSFERDESYYVVVKSQLGTIASQRFYNQQYMATLSGIPVDAIPDEIQPLYIPQAVAFGGTDSTINLISRAAQTANIRLTFRADNGALLAEPVTVQLEPSNKLHEHVDELFGLTTQSTALSGWILIEPDQPGIIGNITLYLFSGRAASSLSMQEQTARRLVFSHVANGLGYSTGLSLLNANSEPTLARVSVYDPDGNLVASRDEVIAPNSRLIGLLQEFFSNLPPMLGGFIRVESDLPIIGVELFYTVDQEVLSAVPAQTLPSEPPSQAGSGQATKEIGT